MPSRPERRASRALVAAVAVGALVAGGCGDDDTEANTDGNDAGAATSDGIEVSGGWARSSPSGVTEGVAYMTIESTSGDRLVGVSVPPDVAGEAALHETVAADDPGATGGAGSNPPGTGAAMTMRHVDSIELPAGEAVSLEPGGRHVMLLDLVEPLAAGESFELTLSYATAATQTVTVEIRDDAP